MRFLWLLLVLFLTAQGCPPLSDRIYLYLNEPGVSLQPVPAEQIETMRRLIGAKELSVRKTPEGVPAIAVVAPRPDEIPEKISTSVDLTPWFAKKECLKSWEAFHRCMNRGENRRDEVFYRQIERKFVSKIVCEEGEKCPEEDFAKWRLVWESPALIRIEAEIGKGGFESLQKAKESLHRINALLKRTVYGARFPEDYGEGTGPEEIFAIEKRTRQNYDFSEAVTTVVSSLAAEGFLSGLGKNDIETLRKLAKGGALIYYLPARCLQASQSGAASPQARDAWRRPPGGETAGWHTRSNSARIRFDTDWCPHLEILR